MRDNQFENPPPPLLVFLEPISMWLRYNIETLGVLRFTYMTY